MSEIEINKMVEMAGERAGWREHEVGGYICNENGTTIIDCYDDADAQFILDAIHALPQLHQQVQDLQAANAALQARVGAWQGVDSPPELEDRGFGMLRTPTLQILVQTTGRMERLTNFPQDKPDWLYKGTGEVIGWRPLPDESPTAAESEEI